MPAQAPMPLSHHLQECIQDCKDCHEICVKTAQHCVEQGGAHAAPSLVRILLDCAEICTTSEDFMARGSELYTNLCAVCADTCARCATACETFPNDAQMKACAELCRRCETSCRLMATGTHSKP